LKVIDFLEKAVKPLISFEIIPPNRGRSADEIYRIVEELMVFNPPFIDVTGRNHLSSLSRHFNISFPDSLVRDVQYQGVSAVKRNYIYPVK